MTVLDYMIIKVARTLSSKQIREIRRTFEGKRFAREELDQRKAQKQFDRLNRH